MMLARSLKLGTRFMTGKSSSTLSRHIVGAIIGIAVSLIPLIVVLEVTTGMISGITNRYLEIGTYHIQVRNYTKIIPAEEKNILSEIKRIPRVRAVFPVITGVGLAYSAGGKTGITLKALPGNYWDLDKGIHRYLLIKSGQFDLTSEDAAMVSVETARNLKVKPGDRIKILTARKIGFNRTVLKPSYFIVKGIFSTGYYELDSLSVYINIHKGEELFSGPENHLIGIKVDNPEKDSHSIASLIQTILPANWFDLTWFNLQKPMYESFKTTKSLLLFIMLLIVLVASVNISSALVMMVIEKEGDIAILKSTGVTGGTIVNAYIYSGFIIGLLGTMLGTVLGLFFAVNINKIIHGMDWILNFGTGILHTLLSPFTQVDFARISLFNSTYYLDYIPIRIDFISIFIICSSTVVLSILAALIPALRAGRIRPMEVMRRQ